MLSAVTVQAERNDSVAFDVVRERLAANSFARVTGVFSHEEISVALNSLRRSFSVDNDRRHDPANVDQIRRNFQKLMIGGTRGENPCPRFLRMFYNPIADEDIHGMRSIFERLIRFRNLLYGLPPEFASRGTENGVWSAARIHHYPSGGGFMAPHTDLGTSAVAAALGLESYVQVVLLLSRKGTDFHDGGAYVELDGQRYLFEDECELGDIVVYDGRVRHGVEEVDPLSPLRLDRLEGRIVALVTLFEDRSTT